MPPACRRALRTCRASAEHSAHPRGARCAVRMRMRAACAAVRRCVHRAGHRAPRTARLRAVRRACAVPVHCAVPVCGACAPTETTGLQPVDFEITWFPEFLAGKRAGCMNWVHEQYMGLRGRFYCTIQRENKPISLRDEDRLLGQHANARSPVTQHMLPLNIRAQYRQRPDTRTHNGPLSVHASPAPDRTHQQRSTACARGLYTCIASRGRSPTP